MINNFVKRTLYCLKRQYGFSIDLYQVETVSVNQKTGQQVLRKSVFHIAKAIVLPSILSQKYFNKMLLEAETRLIVIDKKDAPKCTIIPNNYYLVHDHKRYEIKVVEELEHKQGFLLTVKEVKGKPAPEIIEAKVFTDLQFSQRCTA